MKKDFKNSLRRRRNVVKAAGFSIHYRWLQPIDSLKIKSGFSQKNAI